MSADAARDLTLVIEAGGASRRMGQDKALMPFLGRPLIQRILERITPIASEVLVVANRPEAYAFLGCQVVPDARPGRGALGGLYTAFIAARCPCVAVVACDMPFVSAPLLAFLRDVLIREQADAVVPETAVAEREVGLEPFHAVYRRSACLPAVEAALDAGMWRATAWLDAVRTRRIGAREIAPYDLHGTAFRNVNTPESFAQAETDARAWES